MPEPLTTPQDAEDAFYDAIEDKDLALMLWVWEDSEDVACLLPMQPLVRGRAQLEQVWRPLLQGQFHLDIEVHHIHWLEFGDVAIHYLQERVKPQGQDPAPAPVFATNVYRNGGTGWHLILHQNSPTPPPPEMMDGLRPPPGMRMPG
jgi:ketosteroid isomerase-like protein